MGKVYKNSNHIIILQMIEIYHPEVADWMQYQITKSNILTFHHIKKVSENGNCCIENGALLTKRAHRILNMVESLDIALYNEWNNLFILINKAKTKPCDEYISEAKILKKYTQKIVY